jgi:hypothetical protein
MAVRVNSEFKLPHVTGPVESMVLLNVYATETETELPT